MALARVVPAFLRAKAAFPAVAFFGGFVWDAATLGRSVTPLDLWILSGYLAAAALLLVVMGRRGRLRGSVAGDAEPAADLTKAEKLKAWLRDEGPAFFLQFLFGSLFSALFIFYFLSSSYLPGFLIVLGLLILLVANEFLEGHYHRFTLTWALFGLCAILFLNFALPHMAGSIHPIWFYLSTAGGVGLTFGLKRLSPKAAGSLWPLYASAIALVGLFLVNAIPPVPLVKKNLAIVRNLEKRDGAYRAEIETPPFYAFWRASEREVRVRPGEKIFCFSSVFAPSGFHGTLYHTWRYKDHRKGGWVKADRLGFPIAGGRRDGFRGFTYKKTLPEGKWEVRVETESGRVIGSIRFRAEATADTAMTVKKLILD